MPEVSTRSRIGVLALVPDDWSDPWQRRHQVLTRLSRHFPLAWVSPARHWRDRASAVASLHEARPDADRMHVIAAAQGLPAVYGPRILADALYRRRVHTGLRWLRARGCDAIELQIWRPEFAAALDWIPAHRSSYHIDDEYSWAAHARPMLAVERALLQRCDCAYVTSAQLLESKGGICRETRLSPNGVDFARFATPAPAPGDLRAIARPRVGYVGVLKEQLDWDWMLGAATARPAWSFVLVGPRRAGHDGVRAPLAALARLPNVHVLGGRPHEQLAAYLQHLDVAVLPYQRNEYTRFVNPLKLYEALAAGTPIAAARLPSLEPFAHVIHLADDTASFIRATAAALGDSGAGRRTQRQELARPYDWDAIVQRLANDTGDAAGSA
jgi:glycosyltransferase involved in cell wall biosynthesis